MKKAKIPVAKEGIPFIGLSALATVVFALLQIKILAIAGLILTGFILYFFRDPERIIPVGDGLVVSPADGKVIEILDCTEPYFTNIKTKRVSIFMNVFNCHVNRSPIKGQVIDIKYKEGKFLPANKFKATVENEQAAILLSDKLERKVAVVQVAGLIARRILCLAEVGDELKRGERFGMIRFGSRLDLYLPLSSKILVDKGQKVVAGQSIIAKFN